MTIDDVTKVVRAVEALGPLIKDVAEYIAQPNVPATSFPSIVALPPTLRSRIELERAKHRPAPPTG